MSQIEVSYVDHMGSDLSVVNAARVSFARDSNWPVRVHGGELQALNPRDQKLIGYLAKHKHMSPFGHAFASFYVKAPVFVARQLVKHKFLRWNEVSRRYVDKEPEFYVPEVWRGRASDKKQGSEGAVDIGDLEHEYEVEVGAIRDFYEILLERGVAPEQARMVLPQSTMTEWYWSGSLDAFHDMCVLRQASDTQAETREVADTIAADMESLFPVSWYALSKYK